MATQLQIRRGTSTQVAAFTGAEGEIVVNTTNDSVHVNDGSTAGGFEMARADLNNVSDTDLNAALTGNTVSALTITTLTLGATAITATGTELNLLDGVTATTAELNFVDGVTSAIQTQLDAKAPLANPTFTTGIDVTGTVTADGGTIVSTGSDAFSSKAVGGYAVQAYQDATSSGHTALDLRSDSTTSTRYLIRGYNDAAGTPTEVFSVGADGGAYLSGNVGIGTSSPTYALSVNSGSSTVPASLESTGTDSWLMLKDTNTTLGNVRLGSSSNSLIAFAGGTERMRIDSSGNLLVGTTNATFVSTGRTCFEVNGSTNSIISLADESSGSKESKFYIHNDSSNGFITHLSTYGYAQRWYTGGSEKMRLREGGSLVLGTTSVVNSAKMSVNGNVTTFVIHPAVDNNFDCGHPSYRWDDIRATNGTIQTSDRNEKQDIEALSDAEQRVAVAAKGLMRKFRWISSVEENGDDARIHFGIIAQDLQDAFTAEGLDAGRYAMFISDTWTDEETGEERTRLGVRYSELLAFIISAI